MDGNGRWAKLQARPAIYGHRAGMKTIKRIVKETIRQGLESLSLFALSSENWSRPSVQVRQLMQLFEEALDTEVGALHEQGVRLQFIGEHNPLPSKLINKIQRVQQLTQDNRRMRLNIAFNYGGRWDVAQACRQIATQVLDGRLAIKQISAQLFAQYVCLAEQPSIDLCIRTGNEKRISNFFLWQLAYTELYFSAVLWPEFGARHLRSAMQAFARRERRFGGTHLDARK